MTQTLDLSHILCLLKTGAIIFIMRGVYLYSWISSHFLISENTPLIQALNSLQTRSISKALHIGIMFLQACMGGGRELEIIILAVFESPLV